MRGFRGGFVAPSLIFSVALVLPVLGLGSSFLQSGGPSLSEASITLEATLSKVLSTEASSLSTNDSSGDVTPVAAQTITVQDTTPQPVAEVIKLPYSLTNTGVGSDLQALGYTLGSLQAQGIEVMGHEGLIPKRCASGPSGATTTYGIAIKTTATYRPCADGSDPLYSAYRPAGYSCVVIYNKQTSTKLAILAHELGHCLHFTHGQYRKFDIDYRAIRPVSGLNVSQRNEITADDFMICRHNLDTGWGEGSYYSRYGVARPTSEECVRINTLINTHLMK